jgi:hypothetical protein
VTYSQFSDAAIRRREDDRLERHKFAAGLIPTLSDLNLEEGAAVGLLGKWGSGKSSVLRLLETEIDAGNQFLKVLWLNPWMFSDSETLVSRLIAEFFKQFQIPDAKLQGEIVSRLASLSLALEPVGIAAGVPGAAAGFGASLKAVANAFHLKKSAEDLKKDVALYFKKLDAPILVFIDDLDRLQSDEIRQVMRFLRLVADFPNVLYVVALDESVVGQALDSSTGQRGHEFLEKILTATVRIPNVSTELLVSQLHGEVLANLSAAGITFDEGFELPRTSTVHEYIETPRDAKRIAFAAAQASIATGHRILLEELIDIETLRLKEPSLFRYFERGPVSGFKPNDIEDYALLADPMRVKSAMLEWLEQAPKSKQDASTIIASLFPQLWEDLGRGSFTPAQKARWVAGGRLGTKPNWDLYLSRITADEHLTLEHADQLTIEAAKDPKKLGSFIDSLPASKAIEVIIAFTSNQDFDEVDILPLCLSLATVWEHVPGSPNLQTHVGHVSMLQDIVKEVINRPIVNGNRDWLNWSHQVLSSKLSLSSKSILIDILGLGANPGESRDVQADYAVLVAQLRKEFESESDDSLVGEWALGTLVTSLRRESPDDGPGFDEATSTDVLVNALRTIPVWSTERPGPNHEAVKSLFGVNSRFLYQRAVAKTED